jgi:formamidopyrimidine-DNA glycosylase
MPEINEIRKYRDFIKENMQNEKIITINILNGRYKKHGPFAKYNDIMNKLPLKLLDVKTKGKFLYMVFEKNFYIFSTLGLSGGWCYLKNKSKKYIFSKTEQEWSNYLGSNEISSLSYIKNALNHLNVEFVTKKGSLFYYDVLSFGSLKVIDNEDELNKKLNQIGPDIMEESTDIELFKKQITKNINLNKAIGIVLMNQKIISGIGNYLRADILYLSKINPFRKVSELKEKEHKIIFKNCKALTWDDYEGKLPSNRMFLVYMQEKDMYGNKVVKEELYEGSQKRFIYYVPKIQI